MAKNRFLRTCVCCQTPKKKDELYRFTLIKDEVVLDYYGKLQGRGFYVCKDYSCLSKLNESMVKKSMKREKVSIDIEKILKILKSVIREHILNTIKISNRSGKAIATLNKVLRNIEDVKLLVIAKDISDNSFKKLKRWLDDKKFIKDMFSKDELGEIFSKDEVNVVGVVDKNLSEKLEKLYIEYLGVVVDG